MTKKAISDPLGLRGKGKRIKSQIFASPSTIFDLGTKITIFLIIMAAILIKTVSYAEDLQRFCVKNNGDVVVTISQKELSRLVFKSEKGGADRVKQIFGINGEFHYEIQEENLYIRPSVAKPINFFVSTDSGFTYKVLAMQNDIPSTQVAITGVQDNKKDSCDKGKIENITTGKDASFEKIKFREAYSSVSEESHLREEIRKIISVIKADDRTVGYEVKEIDKEKKDIEGVRKYYESRWTKREVIGDKYYLYNTSDKRVQLDKARYLDDNIQAVYIEKTELNPGDKTLMITIKNIL